MKILTCLIVLFCISSCVDQSNNQSTLIPKAPSTGVESQEDSVLRDYKTDAIYLFTNDTIVQGINDIYKRTAQRERANTVSIYNTVGRAEKGIHYEIVQTDYNNVRSTKHLIITQLIDNKPLIDLEYVAETFGNKPDDLDLDIANQRALWMELCNAHNASNLVEQVYTQDVLYYNHKPLIRGWEAVIEEYAYMNKPNYRLELHPLIIEFVNDQMVFEIGQCKGSYGGKYILIWEKQANGDWKICFDSNI